MGRVSRQRVGKILAATLLLIFLYWWHLQETEADQAPEHQQEAVRQLKIIKSLPKDPLLLYTADERSIVFMQNNFNSKELLRAVKARLPGAVQLKQVYPNITLQQCRFSSFNGEQLNTRQFVAQLLQYRNAKRPITNVIHFFLFARYESAYEVRLRAYLSLLSAVWISGVEKVIIWCSKTPQGHYWDKFVRNVTASSLQHRVMFANRTMPDEVFGLPLSSVYIQHRVDVMRLEAAILFGGFFLEANAVVVKSLQPNRESSCMIGRKSLLDLTMGIFGCRPSSTFHILWYMQYQNYQQSDWSGLSVGIPAYLWSRYPELCQVEDTSVAQPFHFPMLYEDKRNLRRRWDWRSLNSVVYFYYSKQYDPDREDEKAVLEANSMLGEVARFVMMGDNKIRS